jgi:class 3 adenylate cyclase
MATCAQCGSPLPDDARFCPSCAAPVSRTTRAAEERKLATVLFADLVGSTALGDSQDPERTRAMLDRFYDAMAEEIERAGGTLEKFAGDAVMAAFGAPAAQEDHAERALHAALSMQRRLEELFHGRLALRIGVNTGEVVVGRPREGSSFVTGDAVNVAARLEQAAEPGEIVVGERTVAAARGAFEFKDQATVDAKGKRTGVECRRLVRALSLMRPRGVSGLNRAFVGRKSELELLLATYRRVAEQREPHLVTIMGNAGVGKTTLVRELWQRLAIEPPEPLRRTGRCLPYGHGITYWALAEILKEHFGLLENDSPETTRQRLGGREMLGMTLGLDVGEELHPLAARERLREAWADFLNELVAERPTVMLIEDVYWAEEPLLELLERLLRDVRGPLFLIATARPELLDRRPSWGAGRRNSSLLWLEPLDAEDAERMVEELVALELPTSVRELVIERAEGNPFFVEELIGTLIDERVLVRENGGWTTRDLPMDFAVPDSVQAVLAARIDLLAPAEKAALQAASVIGRIFWTGPVCELIGDQDPNFDLLEERDFIRRRGGSTMAGEREYVIKHALTREVAYGSLPKARRARLHAAFAHWLERVGEGRDELAPLLAHHYAEAVRPEDVDLAWADANEELERLRHEASRWLRRAAELAIGRYEIDDGITLLQRALELEETETGRAELWRQIGRANALKFDGPAFWTAMERSLEVCVDRATCADTYAELAYQTAGRAGMWKKAPDRELVDGWIAKALEMSGPDTAARAKGLIAKLYWDKDPSSAEAREVLVLADRLGDPELRVNAWAARALAAAVAERHEEALTWAQRPSELLDVLQDPELASEAHYMPIPSCVALGRFREARRLAGRYDETSQALTPHHRVHGVSTRVELEELLGGWDEIRALQARVREAIAENLDTPCVRNPRSLLVCALANMYAGAEDEARKLEQEAESIWMEGYPILLDPPRLRLALERGELDRVEQIVNGDLDRPFPGYWFGMAARTARMDALAALGDRKRTEREAESLLAKKTYFQPFALRALGVVREDDSLIEQAATRFDEMKLDWHAARTRALL